MKNIVKEVGKSLVLSACFLVGAVGCSEDSETVVYESGEQELGTVRLALRTTDSQGQAYRLSSATIEVVEVFAGTSTSFDASGDEDFILIPVPQGSYSIELLNGWVLEEFDGVDFVPVEASLASPNPVSLDTVPGGSVELDLQFSTLNGSVAFGIPDTLAVSFSVNEATSLVDPSLCGAGQFCIAGSLLATGWPAPSLLNGQSIPFAVSYDINASAPPGGLPPPDISHQVNVNSIVFNTSDLVLSPEDSDFLSQQSSIAPTTGFMDVFGIAPHTLVFGAGPLTVDLKLDLLTDPTTGRAILSSSEGTLEHLATCDDFTPVFGCVFFDASGSGLTATAARLIVQ